MSTFWHYLAVTPIRDYPWWGLGLFLVATPALTVCLLLADMAFMNWVRRRRP